MSSLSTISHKRINTDTSADMLYTFLFAHKAYSTHNPNVVYLKSWAIYNSSKNYIID